LLKFATVSLSVQPMFHWCFQAYMKRGITLQASQCKPPMNSLLLAWPCPSEASSPLCYLFTNTTFCVYPSLLSNYTEFSLITPQSYAPRFLVVSPLGLPPYPQAQLQEVFRPNRCACTYGELDHFGFARLLQVALLPPLVAVPRKDGNPGNLYSSSRF
jgi:hypothetical protein